MRKDCSALTAAANQCRKNRREQIDIEDGEDGDDQDRTDIRN